MAPNTNIKSYLQQQHAVAAAVAAAGPHQAHSISDQQLLARGIELIDSTPAPAEIVRSYDEIDQIYDYIRGLAPLPDNLRRMKSIDFEQIEQRERQKRIQRQQQLQKIQLEQQRKLAEEKKRQQQQQQYLSSETSAAEQQAASRKSVKQRQREEADQSPAAPPLQPIRLTASEVRRPTVKRVESLKLKSSLESEKEARPSASSKPSYLISSSQFRLPRAQSTSSLGNKRLLAPADERALQQTNHRSQMLASINRSDLVEGFVDDDDEDDEEDDESDQNDEAEKRVDKLTETRRQQQQRGSRASSNESANSTPSTSEKSSSSSSSSQTSRSTSSGYENKTNSSRATASNREQSISSSAGTRSQSQQAPQPARNSLKEEHIYEQIPAHRDLHHQIARRAVEASETPRVATVRDFVARQRQRVPSEATGRPSSSGRQGSQTGHSAAYSANLSANARHQQQVAALFASQQRQNLRDRKQHRQAADVLMSQFSPQIRSHHGPSSMPRPLTDIAHHHRLSMGNLHMLAAPIPMATLYTANRQPRQQQPQLPAVYQATDRSSGSSKVHRQAARPAKLSPVELIAGIQMPRAVRKRQVAPSSQLKATSLRPEPLVQQHRRRPSDSAELRQKLACAYVWQEPMRASVKQPALPAPAKVTEMPESNKLSRLAKKRASGRRLTAIGIEQTFDMLGGRSAVPQQQQQVSHAQHRAALQAARANFFEPQTNSGTAPLIDAEEEAELSGATSGPSRAESHLESGQSEKSADSNIKQNHMAAVSSVQAGHRLDSVSDLHSFSSSSSSSSQNSASSPQTTTSASELSVSSGEAELKAADAVAKTVQYAHQDENPAQSGSQTKCYYEQNAPEVPKTSGSQPKLGDKSGRTKKSEAPKSKRLGSKLFSNGERLLSLIGLDTIGLSTGGGGSSSSNTKSADKATNQVRPTMKKSSGGSGKQLSVQQQVSAKMSPRRTSAPPTPLTLLSDNGQQSATASGRRRVSSSAADSVREQTMAAGTKAPRPSLVCHYELPIVEVAKVPSGQLQAKAPQRAKVLPASKRRNAVEQQECGSSGTTNSTGSYEAAIKNSAERRPVAIADENQQALASRKLSAASSSTGIGSHQQQSSLIRVPKLSKQSHLLNRLLPRVPTARAVVSSSFASEGSAPSSSRHFAKSMQPASYTQTLQGRSQHSLTAINPQQVASALLDRYGTARSDPSSASQSRAAQRYLMSQQVRRPLVASLSGQQVGNVAKERSPLSTNLDLDAPVRTGRSQPQLVANQKRRQHQQQSAGSSASLKSPSGQSHNRLSSLGNIHPSPTVTTYTSSGISSTHLATNISSSSSQRSKASEKSCEQLAAAKSAARRAASSSSNTLEGSSSWQQSGEDDGSEDDEIDMIDEPNGNSISPDIMRFGCHEPEAGAPRGHLKSFDERFSSKYVDQQLASSSDSLLESINFSGTLESRKKRQLTTTSKAKATRTRS